MFLLPQYAVVVLQIVAQGKDFDDAER